MKKTTDAQLLEKLKSEYEKRYVFPLLFRFSRPPRLFDDEQIRLRKQVESVKADIEKAILCPDCKGKGVLVDKVDRTKKKNEPWYFSLSGQIIDSRAFVSEPCSRCFGSGIITGGRKVKAKHPMLTSYNDKEKLVCDVCGAKLNWLFKPDEKGGHFLTSCHNIDFKIIPKIFRLEIHKSKDVAEG